MSCKETMWKLDEFKILHADHNLINVSCRKHGTDCAAKMLYEIRSLRQQCGYVDKLLQLTVKELIEKLKDSKYSTSRNTDFDTEFLVISLLTKDADLTAVDEEGNRAADYVLQEIIGTELTYSLEWHEIGSGEQLDLQHQDELMTKLLCALMNKKLLDTPYKWGYSYFSLFVLLGWWEMVEWGLFYVGADVSDNGVCPYIPMDAVFVQRYLGVYVERINSDLFAELIHPSNVNRPIVPGSNPEVVPPEKLPRPLHLVAENRYDEAFFVQLLNAGARIDIVNFQRKFPMDIIYDEYEPKYNDPFLFSRFIPASVGISPTLFIKLLFRWSERSKQIVIADFMKSMFCHHLMLSSGWQQASLKPRYFPWEFKLEIDGLRLPLMKASVVESICDLLTQCGFRAQYTASLDTPRSFRHTNATMDAEAERQLHEVDKVKKKWDEYRTLVPSLRIQSVRVIRSALQVVTEKRLQALPVPKPLQDMISLRPVMEVEYNKFVRRMAQ